MRTIDIGLNKPIVPGENRHDIAGHCRRVHAEQFTERKCHGRGQIAEGFLFGLFNAHVDRAGLIGWKF